MNLTKLLRAHAPISIDMPRSEFLPLWQDFRVLNGFCPHAPWLTPPTGNVKFDLTLGIIPTYGMSLSPANTSGYNACDESTPCCREGCVAFAGKGTVPMVQWARIVKTRFVATYPTAAMSMLAYETRKAVAKHGEIAERLNTFSDAPWEELCPDLFTIDNTWFYDYTKKHRRRSTDRYHLTFSRSEHTTDRQVVEMVEAGRNVAVVFDTRKGRALPDEFLGFEVIDGDKSDARFLDPAGVIVGLRAKGRMRDKRYVKRGFVIAEVAIKERALV